MVKIIPTGGDWSQSENSLIDEIEKRVKDYDRYLENKEVRKSANELRAIWACGNEYLQSAEPWSVFKIDPDKAAMQIRLSLNLIKLYGVLSEPFIPDTAQKIFDAMHVKDRTWPENIRDALNSLPESGAFEVPEVMFGKISDEERETWKNQFAGS